MQTCLRTLLKIYLVSKALVGKGWDAVIVFTTNPSEVVIKESVVLPRWTLYECEECYEEVDIACDYKGRYGLERYNPVIASAFTLEGRCYSNS